jgi:serine phosphatase RsbU (regulator of sigma subunit)
MKRSFHYNNAGTIPALIKRREVCTKIKLANSNRIIGKWCEHQAVQTR